MMLERRQLGHGYIPFRGELFVDVQYVITNNVTINMFDSCRISHIDNFPRSLAAEGGSGERVTGQAVDAGQSGLEQVSLVYDV